MNHLPQLHPGNRAVLDDRRVDDRPVALPNYRRQLRQRICHIGVGAFHRAHQAWYLHRLLQEGHIQDWGICGIGLRAADEDLFARLRRQHGLYSLWELDGASRRACVIGSLQELVRADLDPALALQCLGDPATVLVSLTVTEAGYCLDGQGALDLQHPDIRHDLQHPAQPRSAPGLLVRALALRREAGVAGFTAMSCDNLIANGQRLRAAVLGFAERVQPALRAWIEREVAFPCSMVDRITPVADPARTAALCAAWGVQDEALVVCEPWRQWVMEDHFVGPRPPYERVEVQFSDEVPVFEAMKVGLLNGSHSALSHLGLLLGESHVHEALRRPLLQAWLRYYLQEVATTLRAPAGLDLQAYQQSLLQRYANPAIADRLQRLAQDSSEKFRQTLLPPLQQRLRDGQPVPAMAMTIALWLRYLGALAQDSAAREAYQDRAREALIQRAVTALASGDASGFLAEVLPLSEGASVLAAAIRAALAELQAQGLETALGRLVATP